MTNFHLYPKSGRWTLTTDSGERYFADIDGDERAMFHAMEIAKEHAAALMVHREDGTIAESRSCTNRLA